jgi:hypothetical protein
MSHLEWEEERYDYIQWKMQGCIQNTGTDGVPGGVTHQSSEWYSYSFVNKTYQEDEEYQKYHAGGGRLITLVGLFGSGNPHASEEYFYYGFELYGEPWERWSRMDLQDDTQWERLPGSVKDWTSKHNKGCRKYGLK